MMPLPFSVPTQAELDAMAWGYTETCANQERAVEAYKKAKEDLDNANTLYFKQAEEYGQAKLRAAIADLPPERLATLKEILTGKMPSAQQATWWVKNEWLLKKCDTYRGSRGGTTTYVSYVLAPRALQAKELFGL